MNDARLHPRLQLLLEDLRARIRRYVWLDWVLLAAAVLLVGFWLGLAIDYLPVLVGGSEMPRAARRLWLLVVVAGLIYGTVKTLIARLRRPLPDDSLALLLERQHPDLGGKLLTSVQLRPQTGEDATHSESLLEAVHEEAVSEIDSIDPKRVFQNKPLFQKAGLVAPLGIATIGLCIIAPQTFLQAASRLTLLSDSPWPRQARLEMVGLRIPILYADNESSPDESSTSVDRPVSQTVEFIDGVARVPRGAEAALEIRATAEEPFKVPDVCTLRYRRVNDNNNFDTSTMVMRGQTSLRRIGRVADGYQKFVLDASPIQPIATSMSITVFGLDDRLSDFRIETIEPPAIQNVRIECEYPDYLKWDDSDLAEDDTAAITTLPYRAGIRLPEGSRVRVIGESTKPLGTADVAAIQAGDRTPHSVEITDDGMSISIELADFSKATTVTVVPQDLEGIQAQSPFKFFIGIVLDQPPEVSMRLRGIGSAVTPIAKMPVEIETKDDYGVAGLSIVTTRMSSDSSEEADRAGDRDKFQDHVMNVEYSSEGVAKTEIDLRKLAASNQLPEPVPGDLLVLSGQAADRYDIGPPHQTRTDDFQLQVVAPEKLLALLERRELEFRSRLQQSVNETEQLRDAMSGLTIDLRELDANADGEDSSGNETNSTGEVDLEAQRQAQIRRLRVQQFNLQANKTAGELSGIVAGLDDLILEMVNNRVDSADRRERLGQGVRDPLQAIVDGSMKRLQSLIGELEDVLEDASLASERAGVATSESEQVIVELRAVLERMLELESYNEVLDLLRGLIDDQQDLIDQTQEERKQRVMDLFK